MNPALGASPEMPSTFKICRVYVGLDRAAKHSLQVCWVWPFPLPTYGCRLNSFFVSGENTEDKHTKPRWVFSKQENGRLPMRQPPKIEYSNISRITAEGYTKITFCRAYFLR